MHSSGCSDSELMIHASYSLSTAWQDSRASTYWQLLCSVEAVCHMQYGLENTRITCPAAGMLSTRLVWSITAQRLSRLTQVPAVQSPTQPDIEGIPLIGGPAGAALPCANNLANAVSQVSCCQCPN